MYLPLSYTHNRANRLFYGAWKVSSTYYLILFTIECLVRNSYKMKYLISYLYHVHDRNNKYIYSAVFYCQNICFVFTGNDKWIFSAVFYCQSICFMFTSNNKWIFGAIFYCQSICFVFTSNKLKCIFINELYKTNCACILSITKTVNTFFTRRINTHHLSSPRIVLIIRICL